MRTLIILLLAVPLGIIIHDVIGGIIDLAKVKILGLQKPTNLFGFGGDAPFK